MEFIDAKIFMDDVDFEPLRDELTIGIELPPQLSEQEIKEVKELEEMTSDALAAFAMGNLFVNLFLAVGLKYLWNLVALLQFVIFMRMWLIQMPIKTSLFLKSLKSLALFEFLPTDNLDTKAADFVGIDYSRPSNENSLFDSLAVVIIFGCSIVLAVLLLSILLCCKKTCPKVGKCYDALKQKLLYGTFIRYVQLGTLKI